MTVHIRILLLFAVIVGVTACTQSETPLTSREEGFVDYFLLGKWHHIEVDEDGDIVTAELGYDIRLSDDGYLHADFYDGGKLSRVFEVFSSRIKDKKYANVRVIACPECSEDDLARIEADDCPYQVVQYKTYLPKNLVTYIAAEENEQLADALVEVAERSRGRMVFMALMKSEFVEESIDTDIIEGHVAAGREPCLTAHGSALQIFLLQKDRQIYPSDMWQVLVRAPSE